MICQTMTNYAKEMRNICPTYCQDIPKIYPRYAQDMLKICPIYAKEICKNKLGQNILGQNVHYFYESWGKMSWGKMSLGQNVSGAKCPLAVNRGLVPVVLVQKRYYDQPEISIWSVWNIHLWNFCLVWRPWWPAMWCFHRPAAATGEEDAIL